MAVCAQVGQTQRNALHLAGSQYPLGDTAQELYYTGYEYLNISVIAHYVQYESGGYDLGTYTIRTIDQAQLAQTYGEAVAAYEAGNYREAWDLFATLGSYEDSENYRNLLIHQTNQ